MVNAQELIDSCPEPTDWKTVFYMNVKDGVFKAPTDGMYPNDFMVVEDE